MLRVFQRMCGFAVLSLILPVMADAYTIKYNLMGGVNHPDNPTSYGVNDEVMSVVLLTLMLKLKIVSVQKQISRVCTVVL